MPPIGQRGVRISPARRPTAHVRELTLVKTVTDRLVASLDFREALTTLIEGTRELLGVDRGSILLVDEERESLRIEVARGIDPEVVARTRIPIGHGIAGTVAATGEPMVARDVRQLAQWTPDPERQNEYADLSALCVPLVLRGEVLGVMNFNHKRDGEPFDEADLEFALLIANQAAVVLWSARLHREYLAKQVLDRELAIARAIQERLVPQSLPDLSGFRFAATQHMCQAVGGDYYDLVPTQDGRLALAIGDAAGHGVGSALVAAEARATLRECLARGDGLSQSLARVNDHLQSDTSPEMYMTMLLGLLDPATRFFEFSTAGHHMPVLVRDGQAIRGQPVGSNIPLGFRRGIEFHAEWPMVLRAGDLLLLFTDGIWEAEDDADRRFGSEGLIRVLERDHRLPEPELLDRLIGAVAEHCAGRELEDDLTLVLVRAL